MQPGWLHTNMGWIDWLIIVVSVIAIRMISLSTRHFMKGVADFLSANRCAGRYLLTIALGMGQDGTIAFVAAFQMYFTRGFTPLWWAFLAIPTSLIITLTGYVNYRFRETRALTVAQYFEMRYSRGFRILSGIISFVAGVVNFGIFPAVAAHFFMYFCGLPEYFHIPGIPFFVHFPGALSFLSFHTGNTFALAMAVDLTLALVFVTQGGQISVMVTECVQGLMSASFFIVIAVAILLKLHWSDIVLAMSTHPQPGLSMFNPYDTSKVGDYNVWYFLTMAILPFYGRMSWPGTQGFYGAARTAHEQKMGGIIAGWRLLPTTLVMVLVPIAAYAILHLSAYAALQAKTLATLNGISNAAVRDQMITVVAMAHFLPVGVKGLLATAMIFFSFTCHDTYMHSWGSIFVQDVYMPIKRVVLSPERHIQLLRWAIISVAVFGFFFSLYYPQSQQLLMFGAVSGVILTGGAGGVIIFGLYWRKGTTLAAYGAMITGAIVGTFGVIIYPLYQNTMHAEFPINGNWFRTITIFAALGVYLFLSLIHYRRISARSVLSGIAGLILGTAAFAGLINATNLHFPGALPYPMVFAGWGGIWVGSFALIFLSKRREDAQYFNLEKMLHKGKYAVASDQTKTYGKVSFGQRLFGITEEFSVYDKFLAASYTIWQLAQFFLCIVVSFYNYAIHPIDPQWFNAFWKFYVWQFVILSVPIVIWLQIGGILDIRDLYRLLASSDRDPTDDGRVIHEPDDQVVVSKPAEPAYATDGIAAEEE